MSGRITIPLAGAPAVIAETVRCVLRAHGLELVDYQGVAGARALDRERVEELCREVGNNAAQALLSIDETEEPCAHTMTVVELATGKAVCRDCGETRAQDEEHELPQPRAVRARGRR